MSRVCHGAFITDTTATSFLMLTVTRFSKFRTTDPVRFRFLPISTEVNRSATTVYFSSSLPIHRVLIRIGSKFSLRIALSLQFPSFQESETTFLCGLHGGFVDVVQLKLKKAKSGCFIHFTIHHKNTL